MNTIIRFVFLSVFALSFTRCNSEKQEETTEKEIPEKDTTETLQQEEEVPLAPKYPEYNEIARVISGLPVDSTSKFYKITVTAGWKQYHKDINARYRELDSVRFQIMDSWRKENVTPVSAGNQLLYPFSGPDFLTADIFFPDADSIYMFGLERIGVMPDPTTMKAEELDVYYKGMVRSAADLLRLSFFRTKWMKNDMRANGVAPIICNFIVHRGHVISNITGMKVDTAGNMITIGPLDSSHRIARVEFIDKNTGKLRQVTYFQGDISDAGLKANKGVKRFIEKLKPANTYLKAASYLCHHQQFFGVADLIISRSKLLLQEDSGIPYKKFKEGWDVKLFGKYVYPVPVFTDRMYRQHDDLLIAFKDSSKVFKLPFPLGYHALENADNLMLAIKK
jgi:hypothetical protein